MAHFIQSFSAWSAISMREMSFFSSFFHPPIHDSDILESVTINQCSKSLQVWIGLNLEKSKG